jgi:hypothetical protein
MSGEGIHPAAGAIVTLLDVEIPLQTQHRRNRKGRARCGAVGQLVDSDGAVTCVRCKRKAAR